MNIQQIIDKDPRAKELKETYNQLIQTKNNLIISISKIEADIIKTMGSYEVVAKEIVAKTEAAIKKFDGEDTHDPEPPLEDIVIPEENEDDGFAEEIIDRHFDEELETIELPVTAETDRANRIES